MFDDWRFPGLAPCSFDLIMADPPWLYQMFSERGEGKSAQRQYNCLPLGEIMAFPVLDLAADDCLLWLWATNPMIPQALSVMSAWGFEFKTAGSWNKVTRRRRQHFGTGYILRSSNEPFLIGTRGSPKTTRSVRSSFDGVVRQHSRKPEEGFDAAERLMPKAKRLELFSRSERNGWSSFGDQVGAFDNGGVPEKRSLLPESLAQKTLF